MSRKRPLIGITTRYDVVTERFYLARDYAEAIEAAGGTPLQLPLIPNGEYVSELASELDGLLLPGSASDVDPARYHQEPYVKLGQVHPLRDQMDMLLLDEAERRAWPVLGICYGMQALNVHRGGTLIQDIETQLPDAIKHEQGAPREHRSHRLEMVEGSRMASLNGAVTAYVNSHHHQGIGALGANLRATAWTGDKLIEAIEETARERFVVGVQWHPEIAWAADALSRNLFAAFVEQTRLSNKNRSVR